MAVSPARAAAFEILLRIETTDAYVSELLHSSRFAKLSPADHGLLTELVMGMLRWRGLLDQKIAEHYGRPSKDGVHTDRMGTSPLLPKAGRSGAPLSRKIPALVATSATRTGHADRTLGKLDLEVLTALRLGAYQILFLDRVPRHAAVNESVELVKSAHKRSAAGLVNAVLRKIERAPSSTTIPLRSKPFVSPVGNESSPGLPRHGLWMSSGMRGFSSNPGSCLLPPSR